MPPASSASSAKAHDGRETGNTQDQTPSLLDQSPQSTTKQPSEEPTKQVDRKVTQKKEHLTSQIRELERKIELAQNELANTKAQLGDVDATARVQRHITLLHQYNEIKDVGMGLFGLIADRRGVRVRDVFNEFGVKESD